MAEHEDAEHNALLSVPSIDIDALEALHPEDAQRALEALEEQRQRFDEAKIAANTRRGYESDLLDFFWWCHRHRLAPLPADVSTVLSYLTACASGRPYLSRRHRKIRLEFGALRVSSIRRRLAALRFMHRETGHPTELFSHQNPAISGLMRGIERSLGVRPRQKRGLSVSDIHQMISSIRKRERGARISETRHEELIVRDVALLLFAICSGRRRSEIVALDVDDLVFSEEGVEVLIQRSKTDQVAAGQKIYIRRLDSNYCPVAALKEHLGGRSRGPVFMRLDKAARKSEHTGETPRLHAMAVATVLQKAAHSIGKNPKIFGAHSARRTMATLASRHGAPFLGIKTLGGWRSGDGVEPYIEEGRGFEGSITGTLGI